MKLENLGTLEIALNRIVALHNDIAEQSDNCPKELTHAKRTLTSYQTQLSDIIGLLSLVKRGEKQ